MKYKNGHEGSEGFVSVPTHAEPPLNIRSALSLWGLMAQLRRLIAQLLLAGAIAALLLLLDRDATTEAWRDSRKNFRIISLYNAMTYRYTQE